MTAVTLVVRHGQTASNLAARYAGRSSEPLTNTGRDQIRRLASRLETCGIGQIWTSEVARARESAQIVAEVLGVPMMGDARLNELLMGPWEGLTESEVAVRFPEAFALWQDCPGRLVLEGRETLDTLGARVSATLSDAAMQESPVLLMTHVAPIRVGILNLLALPLRLYKRLRVCNADCIVIDHGGSEARRLGKAKSLRDEVMALES